MRFRSVLTCILLQWSATALAATPTLHFEDSAVVVEAGVADSPLAVFSLERGRRGFMPYVDSHGQLVRTDASGTLRFELSGPVAAWSVWAVVDLVTGGYALAAPPEGPGLREVAFPKPGLGNAGAFLDDWRELLDVLLVRPAAAVPAGHDAAQEVGAWRLLLGDGARWDGDGTVNGRVRLTPALMQPLGDSPPPPERLRPGDVLIAIDSRTLEVYATTLARRGAGEEP
jgi:hypothetical protein